MTFCTYSLRTTEPDAARRFYADAIGLELPEGAAEGSALESWPLHERARALGVPAHWLAQVAVEDLDDVAERLVAMGGQRLGPTAELPSGARFASVRDPFGAVFALRQGSKPPAESPVPWHHLHTTELGRASDLYGELFGWVRTETIDVPDPVGGWRLFAFEDGGPEVGMMANTARWPGVHAQWLIHFPVSDIDTAVARVRDLGGTTIDPVEMPARGFRLAACEDPQGAAFGLVQDDAAES